MVELCNKTLELIEHELSNAENIHDSFYTAHDAYGVIKEELEEALDEMTETCTIFDTFWDGVKHDNLIVMLEALRKMQRTSERAVTESAHVAAMVIKAKAFVEDKLKGERTTTR